MAQMQNMTSGMTEGLNKQMEEMKSQISGMTAGFENKMASQMGKVE